MSAPHMHAILMSALDLKDGDIVLEVGFGSGLLLAYMKEIVGEKGRVFGIEIVPEVFDFGKNNLAKSGYLDKISVTLGDGYYGLAGAAPFDKIVSSASGRSIPVHWIDQLKDGGIIVAPLGTDGSQQLVRLKKSKNKVTREVLGQVEFVPLTGGQ